MQTFRITSGRSVRLFIGALVMLAGFVILLMQASVTLRLVLEPHFCQALHAGYLCALGTALGALPVLFLRSISGRLSDSLMGFGAGVMLAATVFSLLMPGLVEPLFAVLCAWLVQVSALLLPWGLALAAGAMLYAVIHEIIPESHRKGHESAANLGLAAGFCLMMVLDAALA